MLNIILSGAPGSGIVILIMVAVIILAGTGGFIPSGTLPAGGTAVLPGLFFLGLCRPGGTEFRFAAGGAYQGGVRNIGAAFGAIAHGAHLLSFVNPLPKAGSEKV